MVDESKDFSFYFVYFSFFSTRSFNEFGKSKNQLWREKTFDETFDEFIDIFIFISQSADYYTSQMIQEVRSTVENMSYQLMVKKLSFLMNWKSILFNVEL